MKVDTSAYNLDYDSEDVYSQYHNTNNKHLLKRFLKKGLRKFRRQNNKKIINDEIF